MMTEEDNQLLCRVEGDAPMGQLMRRHWQAVCLSEEVNEPDGAPVRARVLGEDLVVFKDSQGRVGVMGEFCPHRGVSLVYARNEHGGLRCLYHGWKMNVSGEVLEMSSEPSQSTLPSKVHHTAYPALEWGGFVWCFMGPKDTFTEFTPPPWAPHEHVRVSICKMIIPCNWAQILEGQIDSAHSSSLHSSDMMPARLNGAFADEKTWLRPSTDKAPRMQVQTEPYGFRYVAIRRPIEKAATHDYVRCTVFLAPASALIPPNNAYNVANINTAIDDTHTAFHFIAWGDAATTPDTQTWRAFLHTQKGVDVDEHYHPIRCVQNHFLQDRQTMKAGNYTGIQGIPNQDLSMWVTMGAITQRSQDRLGASDMAVVEFRKQMLHEVKAFARGEAPIGVGERQAPVSTCSFQAIVEKSTQWQQYAASPIDVQVP
jgi:phthalate 4,5-dioxygenase oxygenase subunit